MLDAADLPDDVAALKTMLIAAQVRELAKDFAIASKDEHIARKDERIERLEKLVAAFKQAAFGRKSEKTDPDQFDLALEDLETAIAVIHAEDEADTPALTFCFDALSRRKSDYAFTGNALERPSHVRSIVALFQNIFPEWKR